MLVSQILPHLLQGSAQNPSCVSMVSLQSRRLNAIAALLGNHTRSRVPSGRPGYLIGLFVPPMLNKPRQLLVHTGVGCLDPAGAAPLSRLHACAKLPVCKTHARQSGTNNFCAERGARGLRHPCAGCQHKRAVCTATSHNETAQACHKSNIYTIATMLSPECHTRVEISCCAARKRSTLQRAGAPF